MRIDSTSSKAQLIIFIISYLLIFLVGFYSGSNHFSTQLILSLTQNQTIDISDMNSTALNTTNTKPSFTELAFKYGIDKVTFHGYQTMYENYLRRFINSNPVMLEIGLGCGMEYGPGLSAYTWREYFGPLATIHFIEYERECGEAWYNVHGKQVSNR